MKILFVNSKFVKMIDLPWAFLEIGIEVELADMETDYMEPDEQWKREMEKRIGGNHYDAVATYNFIPVLSEICQKKEVKYMAWTFDAPLFPLYTQEIKNDCNYIFAFDRTQYEDLAKWNLKHLYYLPLAVNLSRIGGLVISQEDEKEYTGDVTFVGNLYHDNAYNEIQPWLGKENETYLKGILKKIEQNLDERDMAKYVTDEMIEFFNHIITDHAKNCFQYSDREYYGYKFFARKVSELDRMNILNELSSVAKVKIYTANDTSMLRGVEAKGPVAYDNNMNKIFFLSKINLNITMRGIKSGIPLRVFDIMGSGGFLMTNYQKEMRDFFVPGVDYEEFHTIEELKEKTVYYLNHEEERLRIAINGYQKVRDSHTYLHRVREMVRCMNE